jgi:hypothetical protein
MERGVDTPKNIENNVEGQELCNVQEGPKNSNRWLIPSIGPLRKDEEGSISESPNALGVWGSLPESGES